MRTLLASILLCILICGVANIVVAQPTNAPTNNTKWEDRPTDTKRTFEVNVGGGTTFSVATETLFNGNDFSTIVSITSSRNAWMGLIVGTRMIGATALIGLNPADPGNAALGFQAVNMYNLPSQTFDPARDVVPLVNGLAQNGISNTAFAVIGGKSVLNFTVTQSASQSFPVLGNAPGASVTIAFVTGTAQKMDYHASYTFQSVSFSTTADGAAPIPTAGVTVEISLALAYHIALMIIAWLLILPTGAVVALTRIRRGPKASGRWFKFHRGLQMGGVALGFAGWVAGIIHLDQFGTPHLSKGHHNFGYAIGALSLVQVVNGLMRPHAPQKGESPTTERARWFLSHRSLGCILLLGGITNSIIGANVVQEILGGGDTIVVFPGTSGIAAKDLYSLVLGLGIVGYLILVVGTVIDPIRRRREGSDGSFQQMDNTNNKRPGYEPPAPSRYDGGGGGGGASQQPAFLSQIQQRGAMDNSDSSPYGGGGMGMGMNMPPPPMMRAPPPPQQSSYMASPPPPPMVAPRYQQQQQQPRMNDFGYNNSAPAPNAGYDMPSSSAGRSNMQGGIPPVPTRAMSPPVPQRNQMGYPQAPSNNMYGGGGGGYPGREPSFNPARPPMRPAKPMPPSGFN